MDADRIVGGGWHAGGTRLLWSSAVVVMGGYAGAAAVRDTCGLGGTGVVRLGRDGTAPGG